MHLTVLLETAQAQEPTKKRAETRAGTRWWLRSTSRIALFRSGELLHGLGEIERDSLEEGIWRELGALPPSRR